MITAFFILVIAFLVDGTPIISFNNGFNAIYGGFGWFPTFTYNIPKLDGITIKIEFYFELPIRKITTIKEWSKRRNIFTTHDFVF